MFRVLTKPVKRTWKQFVVDGRRSCTLEIGSKYTLSKAFSEKDVIDFSNLSEDRNPLHLDAEFAKTSRFGQRIVHGALTSSLLSGLMGSRIFKPGAIYVSQQVQFTAPLFIDENVTVEATIANIKKNRVTVSYRYVTDNNKEVMKGEAVAIVPKEQLPK
ncbi:DgyrCDS11236 [Dimorphilus gyrociliatus]|uniref:DgyrCDS11236 n=1 Tax=Dimorphilus gyrociliatus TaxID=2664684 RepID=A0A7I8W575_9ANNE|nr:DgyrCDS11236 [Dimorphilus gyrociliatus]